MQRRAILWVSVVALGAALLVTHATTGNAQKNPSERDALSGWRFQSGSSQTVGTFSGTLVCMSDATPSAKAGSCPQYGLRIVGKTQVRPLLPGTPEVEKQILSGAMTDKPVLIVGVDIPETGQILVSGVTPQK